MCEARSIARVRMADWTDCMRELSMHILDVMENAVEAEADRVTLTIDEDLARDRLTIRVEDNGRGMSEGQLARVADPFYTTRQTRHVGLGIPLFKAAAERCNGHLVIESEEGEGTRLVAVFQHSHIDRAPLGNVADTLMAIILSGACDVRYTHRIDERSFEFDTMEIRDVLEDVPLGHPTVRNWMREAIVEGEAGLREGTGRASR